MGGHDSTPDVINCIYLLDFSGSENIYYRAIEFPKLISIALYTQITMIDHRRKVKLVLEGLLFIQ